MNNLTVWAFKMTYGPPNSEEVYLWAYLTTSFVPIRRLNSKCNASNTHLQPLTQHAFLHFSENLAFCWYNNSAQCDIHLLSASLLLAKPLCTSSSLTTMSWNHKHHVLYTNVHVLYFSILPRLPTLSHWKNKRAQRALGHSPEKKVKGHSGANNSEPKGHNLNNFGKGPLDDAIYQIWKHWAL